MEGIQGDDLNLKMKFENPTKVSLGSKPDVVVATVVDESFFSSNESPASLTVGTQIVTLLPRLLPGEAIESLLATSEKLTESAASTFMTG